MKIGRLDAQRSIRMDSADMREIGPCDVPIKVACTGICGTDLGIWREGTPEAGAVLGPELAERSRGAVRKVLGFARTSPPISLGTNGLSCL